MATAAGMKRRGGGKLTIEDFLPEYCRPKKKKKSPDEDLQAQLMAMAIKTGTYHGKE